MLEMSDRILTKNIIIAYLIGMPIGLFAILFIFALPVMLTGEGFATIILVNNYGVGLIGLIITFVFSIWFGAKVAHNSLKNNKSLILSSFKFSISINSIIWVTFLILTLIGNINEPNYWILIIAPIGAFIISVLISTFTVGIIICYFFNYNLKYS